MSQVPRALSFALAVCLSVGLVVSTVAQRGGPRGPGGPGRGPGRGPGFGGSSEGPGGPASVSETPSPPPASGTSAEGSKGSEGGTKPEAAPSGPSVPSGPVFAVVPQKLDGQQLISFSFDGADIDDVIKFLAEASGKIIYKHPEVQTKVTIVSMAKVTVADAFRVLAGLLSVKGYTMSVQDDEVRIMPAKAARLQAGARVQTGKEPEKIPPGKEIITQIMQIEYVDAVKLKEDLAPLFPGQGENGILIANADTNTLVIIDEADSVRRIAEIIKQLDRDTSEALKVEVITLKYADATKLAPLLTELFQPRGGLAGLPADVQRRLADQMRAAGGGGAAPGGVPGLREGLTQLRGEVRVVGDERTNSVVVSASENNMKTIKDIVKALDADVRPKVVAQVFPLESADATTVAEQLNQLFESSQEFSSSRQGGGGRFFRSFYGGYGGGGPTGAPAGLQENRVVADVRTNSVIVTTTQESMPEFEALIKQLDKPSEVQSVVRVFELENAVASKVASVLYDLFQGAQQGRSFFFFLFGQGQSQAGRSPLDMLRDVNIIADDQSNKLLVSGPAHTFELVEELVKALDQAQPQVFIEVVITDVRLGTAQRFGIEWTAIDPSHFGHGTTGEFGADLGLGAAEPPAGFTYSVISRNFRSLLEAMESDENVEVVSTPHIMAMDNTEASISIGEKIPYTSSTAETTGGAFQTNVELLEVAITLNVTPHINASDQIALDIKQVIDSFLEFVDLGGGARAPRTQSRTAQTSVLVKDGETVVIGGIMSDRDSVRVTAVPILSKIPLLGELFKHKQKEKTKTELMVFLTPHIIRTTTDQQSVMTQESGKLSTDPFAKPQRRPIKLERGVVEGESAAGTETKVVPLTPEGKQGAVEGPGQGTTAGGVEPGAAAGKEAVVPVGGGEGRAGQ